MNAVSATATSRIVSVLRCDDWLAMVTSTHCCWVGKHEVGCWTLQCFCTSSFHSRPASDLRSSVRSTALSGPLAHVSPRDSECRCTLLVSVGKSLALGEVRGSNRWWVRWSCSSTRSDEFVGLKVKETNAPCEHDGDRTRKKWKKNWFSITINQANSWTFTFALGCSEEASDSSVTAGCFGSADCSMTNTFSMKFSTHYFPFEDFFDLLFHFSLGIYLQFSC